MQVMREELGSPSYIDMHLLLLMKTNSVQSIELIAVQNITES